MNWPVTANPERFDEAMEWFDERVPVTKSELDAMTSEQRQQAFTIAGTNQLAVVQSVLDSLRNAQETGKPIGDFRKEMKAQLKGEWTKAKSHHINTIFVNATQHAYGAGRFNQMTKPVTLKVRPFWVYDAVQDSRTTHICFPGSTVVQSPGPVKALSKRYFTGEMIVVTTASGKKLRGTPNHPILTSDGWLPLAKLKPGEHVVYAVTDNRSAVVGAQDVCVPSTFADVADALFVPSVSDIETTRSTAADFHGDAGGFDDEVHVASPHGDLRTGYEAACFEQAEDRQLGGVHGSGGLPTGSAGKSVLVGSDHALPSVPPEVDATTAERAVEPGLAAPERCQDVPRTSAGTEQRLGPVDVGSRFTRPAVSWNGWHDTNLLQSCRDAGDSAFVIPGHGGAGFAFTVTPDNVVDVDVEEFSHGLVYNLQTGPGTYLADGLIVHNCIGLDGLTLPADDPQWGANYPPMHHLCRSGIRTERRSVVEKRGGPDKSIPDYQRKRLSERKGEKRKPKDIPLPKRAKGFGKTPNADPWKPKKADYDPAAWSTYQRKQRELRKP